MKRLSHVEFHARIRAVHGETYDLSKTNYQTAKDKVIVICRKHGEFSLLPGNLQRGAGCPKCADERTAKANTLTNDQFLEKVHLVHGDTYDLSKVEYINAKTNVTVICREHGSFYKLPSNLLSGGGCPKCGKQTTIEKKTISHAQFLKRMKEKYGDTLDFSMAHYEKATKPVTVICQIHGEFKRKPMALNKNGCPECNKLRSHQASRLTNDQFVIKAFDKHGDYYEYPEEYTTARTRMRFFCPKHGEFYQVAADHLRGGCNKCGTEKTANKKTTTPEEYFRRANETHGKGTYDYSESIFTGMHNDITIRCRKHGYFTTNAFSHVRKHGCPDCGIESQAEKSRLTHKQFVERATAVHNGVYKYPLNDYHNSNTSIGIECPNHGIYYQKPSYHLQGNGCPKCNMSKGELAIMRKLEEIGIKYEPQKVFDELKDKRHLPFDFYLPDHNVAIEFHGRQHFENDVFFHKTDEDYLDQVKKDSIKERYCHQNGIQYVVIPHWEQDQIEDILERLS